MLKLLEKILKKEFDVVTTKKQSKYVLSFAIGILIIAFAALAFSAAKILEFYNFPDSPNLSTLIIEIGVGIIIALIIFTYTKKNEKQLKEALAEIKKMVKNQHDFVQNRQREVNARLFQVMENMLKDVKQIIQHSEEWKKETDLDRRQNIWLKIYELDSHLSILAEKNLDNPTVVSNEFFLDHELGNFKIISDLCKTTAKYIESMNFLEISHCYNLGNMLPDHINFLKEKLA